MAGRPGVPGRRCLGVAKVDLRKAGVSEVHVVLEGENKPGSEKRTLFDLWVDGVLRLTLVMLSDTIRAFTGEHSALFLLFDLRRAVGISSSVVVEAAMLATETLDAFVFRESAE